MWQFGRNRFNESDHLLTNTTCKELWLGLSDHPTTISMALQTKVPHLMSLADLTAPQITTILRHSLALKQRCEPWLKPIRSGEKKKNNFRMPAPTLFGKTIALLFSKRSTRTRISAETSATLLGGSALFLGRDDIQFGLKESTRDSARVIGGMCQGIFARVGEHEEIEVRKDFFFSQIVLPFIRVL